MKLDIYDDPELDVIIGEDIPDFVKESEIKSKQDYDRFAFKIIKEADTVNPKMPISDRASTWLSKKYFDKAKDKLTKEAKSVIKPRLFSACERYHIDYDDNSEIEKRASQNDNAMIKESNLIKEENKNNETFSHFLLDGEYPAENEDHLKEAEQYFDEYKNHFELDEKREFCENLTKRANELNYEINDNRIYKFASSNSNLSDSFKIGMSARKEIVDEESEKALDAIMEKKAEIPNKILLELVEEFDKEAGLEEKWGREIPEPDLTVNGHDKDINKVASSITYNGKNITREDIRNIPREKLEEYFGDEQIDELYNTPTDVFYALPDPHKEIIADLVK